MNTTHEKANSFRDNVHSQHYNINPSLLVKIGKQTELLLEGDYLDDKRTVALAYAYSNAALGNKNIYDTISVIDLSKYKQRNDIHDITATTITHKVQRRAGLYAQDLISITEQLKLLAGIKTELFKRKVSANITVYRIVNSNLAQMAITDASGNANNNSNIKELASEVTSKQVEIDIMSKLIHRFQFNVGYS